MRWAPRELTGEGALRALLFGIGGGLTGAVTCLSQPQPSHSVVEYKSFGVGRKMGSRAVPWAVISSQVTLNLCGMCCCSPTHADPRGPKDSPPGTEELADVTAKSLLFLHGLGNLQRSQLSGSVPTSLSLPGRGSRMTLATPGSQAQHGFTRTGHALLA